MKKDKNKLETHNPIWLSISEAAKICGIGNRTIRRAIKNLTVEFKIVNERYFVDFISVVIFLQTNIKLKNKFYQYGLGQYLDQLEKNIIEKKNRNK
ncbi:MAG: helix-turn-helix domain-containing protein [Candidatus Pacebacteria bacterium]|nr:helix-turn-helix domain-containing protein [Candidatus Paceibacterota bacterium]